MKVTFKALHSSARIPTFATEGAAAADLYSVAPVTLPAGSRALVPTGLAMQMPIELEAQVRARSGLAVRHGITVMNGIGTIDSDYRGEVKVILFNSGSDEVHLEAGTRIAQMAFCIVERPQLAMVRELGDTERGDGGFGSTGC